MSDNLADVKGEARPGSTQLQTHAEQSGLQPLPQASETRGLFTQLLLELQALNLTFLSHFVPATLFSESQFTL